MPSIDEERPLLRGRAGSYRIGEPLGQGGFGITHRATRVEDGAELVVKQLRMERVDDWKAVELFEREARTLAALEHPNIPRFIDHFPLGDGDIAQGYALVQALVPGRTLEAIRRDGGGLDRMTMRRMFLRLLEVCQFLHERRPPVIHRDISPKNVIQRPDDEPVLIDFGMVQAAMKGSESGSTSAGTFGYAPMEQFVGRAVPSSDLYGLAVTWIAVATGLEPEQMPFDGNRLDVHAALAGQGVDARLLLALEAMTEPDVARRQITAEGLLQRLGALRDGGAAKTVDPGVAPSTPTGDIDHDRPPTRTSATQVAAPATATRIEAPDDEVHLEAVPTWHGARARAIGLGDRAWPAPGAWSPGGLERVAVSGNGARAVLANRGVWLVELSSMTARCITGDRHDPFSAGLSPDGRRLVVGSPGGLELFEIGRDGALSKHLTCNTERGDDDAGEFEFSPDGALFVRTTPSALEVFSWDGGHIEQRLPSEPDTSATFSADGRFLVAQCTSGATFYALDGRQGSADVRCIAFALDGRTVAMVESLRNRRHIVHVGLYEDLAPLTWTPRELILSYPLAPDLADVAVELLAFSPDARQLAAVLEIHRDGESRREIHVVDLSRDEVVQLGGRDAWCLERVRSVAFGARATLWVDADIRDRLTDDDQPAVLVYSLGRGRALGAIFTTELHDGDETLAVRTPDGITGRWTSRLPLDGEAPQLPFERPALIARLLGGEPAEQLLDEVEADGLRDVRLRLRFLSEMRRRGHIVREGDLRPLVDATRGLTHLLPWMLQEALRTAARARFGQSATDQSTVASLLQLARKLHTRSADERDVLFEDGLAFVASLEQARHAELAAQRVALQNAVDRRGRARRRSIVALVLCATLPLTAVGLFVTDLLSVDALLVLLVATVLIVPWVVLFSVLTLRHHR